MIFFDLDVIAHELSIIHLCTKAAAALFTANTKLLKGKLNHQIKKEIPYLH